MSLLLLRDVTKSFDGEPILRGACLRLEAGEILGLVGRNGCGKTTLLKLIRGREEPDTGEILLQRGARLGFVPQTPEFPAGETVRQHVLGGLAEALALRDELSVLADQVEAASGGELDRLVRQQATLQEQAETLGAWDAERRVDKVLSGIGLSPSLWEREADTLSGGEKSRVALSRALVGGHDLLLLDEPTNHLDLDGIEWLESFLTTLESAVLLVSHDRRLLDNSVDALVDLEQGQLTRYPGGYASFLVKKAEQYERELKAYEVQQDMIRREQAFIRKLIGSTAKRANAAKSRRTRLEHVERLHQPHLDVRRPMLRPPAVDRGSELVLEVDGLAGRVPGRTLFEGLDLRLGKGQRLGLLGRNGTGKSTLLQLLAGRTTPATGLVRAGHKARCGYYDQETSDLDPEQTAFGHLRRAYPTDSDAELRGWLGKFLFRGDEADRPAAVLSGGERARLSLALLLKTNPSWLALDEPTNHLDLAGRTALEEMLSGYEGAVVFVSHDRAFLDALCTDVIEVGTDATLPDGTVTSHGVRHFPGNYSSWRDRKRTEASEDQALRAASRTAAKAATRPVDEAPASSGSTPTPATEPPSSAPAAGDRIKNPYKFKQLEQRIMALEQEQTALHEQAASEGVFRDPERARAVQLRIMEVESELADSYETWENWATH